MTEKERLYNAMLVIRCRKGDQQAFESLIQCWENRLFYFIHRLIPDEQRTWQVLQETWLEVLKSIQKLKDPMCLSTWIYRIARNKAVDLIRKEYRLSIHYDVTAMDASQADQSDHDIQAFDNAEQVHAGLAKLSIHHREILTLFFLEDLSLKEIAHILSISVGTVKSRIFHAKKTLRTILEQQEVDHA